MCGIFGWIKPSKDFQTNLDLTDLFKKGLVETQSRGADATGYYSLSSGVVKDAVPAKTFVKGDAIVDLQNERFVIGHCRQASAKFSKENVDDPRNAHPFESDHWVLVHNGTCDMPAIKNYKYIGGTDSEKIVAYIERSGMKAAIKHIDGSAALVLYNKATNKMYFWTDGDRPMNIALFDGMIFFASTKVILRNTLKPIVDHEIFHRISFAIVYENEILEYDFNKNKFTRKEVVEADPPDNSKAYSGGWTSSQTTLPLQNHKPLPRGCVSNPQSKALDSMVAPITGPKVVRISAQGKSVTQLSGN